jgi:hypothetical protein
MAKTLRRGDVVICVGNDEILYSEIGLVLGSSLAAPGSALVRFGPSTNHGTAPKGMTLGVNHSLASMPSDFLEVIDHFSLADVDTIEKTRESPQPRPPRPCDPGYDPDGNMPYPYNGVNKRDLQPLDVIRPRWIDGRLVKLIVDWRLARIKVLCYGCDTVIKTLKLGAT